MRNEGFTAALKAQALREGLDLVGVAAAGPATSAVRFEEWLDAGMHADMDYLKRTASLRSDPARILEDCRSVVAVAMSYRSTISSSSEHTEKDRVWISQYAWGRDYHKVLKKIIIRLGRWLSDQKSDAVWRACVDTAPILEREWATRAGLGWIGKNTMLINRNLGSELFLGALLTDVELAPDDPVAHQCGGCTACLDACPTNALISPGLLDARRCIAYLTIEHRSAIPDDLHRLVGRHAAGCDICNEVCPFTKKAPASRHPEFQPAPHRIAPPLAELQSLSEDGWRTWRQGSALNRIPFATLRETLRVIKDNC